MFDQRAMAENCGPFGAFMVSEELLYQEIDRMAKQLEQEQNGLTEATRLNGGQPSTFVITFEKELSRIVDYVVEQRSSQELSAKMLLNSMTSLVESTDGSNSMLSKDVLQGNRNQADKQVMSCLALQHFTKKNAEILKAVAQKADMELGTSCGSMFRCKASSFGQHYLLVAVFSDIYAALRAAETHQRQQDGKWVAPASFERSTTKFWVEEERLPELLLLCSTEAPLLVYGKSGQLTSTEETEGQSRRPQQGDSMWKSLATTVSSVYFDSVGMDLYHPRILREEGAQLLRARWYGPKPKGSEPIFLELKTHHESWVNAKSVKECVAIQTKDMGEFLSALRMDHGSRTVVCERGRPDSNRERP